MHTLYNFYANFKGTSANGNAGGETSVQLSLQWFGGMSCILLSNIGCTEITLFQPFGIDPILFLF